MQMYQPMSGTFSRDGTLVLEAAWWNDWYSADNEDDEDDDDDDDEDEEDDEDE